MIYLLQKTSNASLLYRYPVLLLFAFKPNPFYKERGNILPRRSWWTINIFRQSPIGSPPSIHATKNICERQEPPVDQKHDNSLVFSFRFDLHQSAFFNSNIRARIVQFILDRQRYSRDNNHDFSFGIDRLLDDETYIAAYPLHDGDLSMVGSRRHLLYTKWASLKKFWQYQPLDYIKDYFGVKIGIYFAWLGFYTYMLILASIAGVICFFYSLKWMKNNPISQQICDNNQTLIMCPLCDRELSNPKLNTSDLYVFQDHVTTGILKKLVCKPKSLRSSTTP